MRAFRIDDDRIETYRRVMCEAATFLEEAADIACELQTGAPRVTDGLVAKIDQARALALAAGALAAPPPRS